MLEINNLSKSYGTKKVLDNISCKLEKEIIGVLGNNGAGKTTFLKALIGLLKIDGGNFRYNGENFNPSSNFWRKKIGYLPQSPGLYEKMNVTDYLDYMLLLSNWKSSSKRKARIDEMINVFDLNEFISEPIANLSGGTKQRVAIAQSVIHNPEILFLDEASNNLDIQNRQEFHEFLISSFDGLVLYIGHIIEEMEKICSKIIIIHNTKILYFGSPCEINTITPDIIKQVELDKEQFTKELQVKTKILKIDNNVDKVIIRYDKRTNDFPNGVSVLPTLEEAVSIICEV